MSLFLKVVVGTTELSTGTEYPTDYTIAHDDYIPYHSNDIGLIRLLKPIQFNENVQPIHYSTLEVPVNTKLKVFGFGKLSVRVLNLFRFVVARRIKNDLSDKFILKMNRNTVPIQRSCKCWMCAQSPMKNAVMINTI